MIIIDTHIWIWWMSDPDKLSEIALHQIDESNQIGVSAISCWEVAMLVSKERLALNLEVKEWIETALKQPKINLIHLSPAISVLSTRLPGKFHGDPADKIITASSIENKAALITKDQRILDYKFVKSIW